jgi:hypothetical protein
MGDRSAVPMDPVGVLTPYERCSELVTGLILTLSVAGSVSVTTGDGDGRSALLLAILGCNAAWGAVDAALYLLSQRFQRSRRSLLISAIASSSTEEGRLLLGRLLPDSVAAQLSADEIEGLRRKIAGVRLSRERLSSEDWRGAAAIFFIVVLGSFPVALPFALPLEPRVAVRVSYGIALLMLLALGIAMGRYAGINPWRSAGILVGLGSAMVAVVILLGG